MAEPDPVASPLPEVVAGQSPEMRRLYHRDPGRFVQAMEWAWRDALRDRMAFLRVVMEWTWPDEASEPLDPERFEAAWGEFILLAKLPYPRVGWGDA